MSDITHNPKPPLSSLLEEKGGIQLDLGCGENKQPGFVGMDVRDVPGVDIVHNWSDIPWPLPDDICVRILCSHVVEHVNPADFGFIKFMNEAWRVMKVDGQMAIVTPYAGSRGYWQDPTHVNPCNEATWAYFDPEAESLGGSVLYGIYKPRPWKIEYLYWDVAGNIELVLKKRAAIGEDDG